MLYFTAFSSAAAEMLGTFDAFEASNMKHCMIMTSAQALLLNVWPILG